MTGNPTAAGARHVTVPCAFCGTLNRVDLSRASHRPRCGECQRPMLLDRPIKLSDADLERVLEAADVPVLVDFYADWCAPCKVMAPLLDDLARDRMARGEALVAKVDTDRSPVVAGRYAIRAIPTTIAFRAGQETGRETGAIPRDRLDALLGTAGNAT